MCEINSHGGFVVENRILEECIKNGAILAQPGEFTKRAFLNGRIDLSQAEAVIDVINSKTEKEMQIAQRQLEGSLSKKIKAMKNEVMDLMADIEASIDYPEYEDAVVVTRNLIGENITDIEKSINNLLKNSKKGLIVKNGLKISIVGKPNVGKSSILNLLLNEEKAIVTNIKGTTRDIVEGSLMIEGVKIDILDTAGIHETNDIVEKIGVGKSIQAISDSDLVLFVVDSESGFDHEDMEVLDKISNKNRIQHII